MKIVIASALFIIMFLSIIDGVVSISNVSQTEPGSVNNTTQQQTMKLTILNRTMIHQQSNYYSQYPVQVTLPVMNNDIITIENDVLNSEKIEQSFRLLIPPSGYDDTLCTPLSSTMIELLKQPITGDIDSIYLTGLLIKTIDTARDNNCTLSNIVSNVIELNRMLPESELIQFLIFPQDNNNVSSSIQIDTINNNQVATNNDIISELIRSNITIVYLNISYVEAYMTMIQNNEYMISVGCSPYLFEPESTTCNFIYQLNETTMNSDASSSGQTVADPYSTAGVVLVYGKLGFGILVVIGLVGSCIYQRYHPVTAEQIESLATLEKEKIPTVLTNKQFDSLPKMKYTLDLIEMLKNDGNTNKVKSSTTVLDDLTTTNVTLSMEQTKKDEMIVQANDCISTNMTNTTRIKDDDDENKLNCSSCHDNKMSDLEAPILQTIPLDSRDNNINSDNTEDECGVCCPICIEEFVVDEIVVVLPKCNHLYHKHCIREWLIKKQGCCPYCKVIVIDVVVDDDETDNNNNNNDNQQ